MCQDLSPCLVHGHLHIHRALSPCVCLPVQISPFHKDTSQIRLGAHPTAV